MTLAELFAESRSFEYDLGVAFGAGNLNLSFALWNANFLLAAWAGVNMVYFALLKQIFSAFKKSSDLVLIGHVTFIFLIAFGKIIKHTEINQYDGKNTRPI